MTSAAKPVFYGDMQHEPARRYPDAPTDPEPYLATDDLRKVVNLAIYLRRPLLLEGEAGCGKTRLARAVAYELGLPFYNWAVRSTSKAQEGLYTYDSILRLHDVQTAQLAIKTKAAMPSRDPNDPSDYRRLGALGEAFSRKDCPSVVLIDEIDKADVDFPNDLLEVLDEFQFKIPETGETIKATKDKPIVIITSNKEKGNLPAPFLRRCIYYFIEFPNDPQRLKQIVAAHFPRKAPPDRLVDLAVKRFVELRNDESLHKKPGTSEFLNWLEALNGFKSPAVKPDTLTEQGPYPYPELLFKLRIDWQKHARLAPST